MNRKYVAGAFPENPDIGLSIQDGLATGGACNENVMRSKVEKLIVGA